MRNLAFTLLIIISGLTVFSQPNELDLKIWLDDSISMEFVKADSIDIWVSKYEVTNQQYKKFMRFRDGSSIFGQRLDQPDQPAVFVSYCDALGFLYWINSNVELPDGVQARLMTGEEWDYLINIESQSTYPWGDDWPPTSGNYLDESGYDSLGWEWHISSYKDGFVVSAPVQLTSSNQLGIHGLADNVREWTSEKEEKKEWHFIRGASWRDSKKEFLQSNYKVAGAPWGKDNHIGFRVVLSGIN